MWAGLSASLPSLRRRLFTVVRTGHRFARCPGPETFPSKAARVVSAGAYRRAPCSTRVGSILGIIGGDEDSQGGAVRLDELKSVQTC